MSPTSATRITLPGPRNTRSSKPPATRGRTAVLLRRIKLAVFAFLAFSCALLSAQLLPLEPVHESGASVTGAFEGWFKNSDGSYTLLFGYFNRNTKQELDIPIGASNSIEPGGPDR